MRHEEKGLATEVTYFYSGKYHTVELNLNKKLYPKHLSAAKRAYGLQELDKAIKFPIFLNKVKMTYILHPCDNRRRDRSNVLAIVEKFFNDCLVKSGKIKDDSDEIIVSTTYISGSPVKGKKKVTVIVEGV